ncbi:MAG: TIGR03618 family F420-dependent PPOX class oxidoreductase [Chloroflexi bacterium]|nr:TIGR03618 family F420-dependent PPOX class oxidoreductase [Chloroflexota bacterium]
MLTIPEKFADLFAREKKAIANLALVMKNGTPQVTPIWFDYDGTHIIINTARGRVKDKILRRHPKVALAISDPTNPYRYIQVRGMVVAESEEGGYEMICQLNQKYHGNPNYPKRPGEVRVTYEILPEHMNTMG